MNWSKLLTRRQGRFVPSDGLKLDPSCLTTLPSIPAKPPATVLTMDEARRQQHRQAAHAVISKAVNLKEVRWTPSLYLVCSRSQ